MKKDEEEKEEEKEEEEKSNMGGVTEGELRTKTVCVVDNGLFISFARKIASGFKKVYYYTPYQSAFVQSRQLVIGSGFDEIERILDPQSREDEVDLWVFLDLYQSDWQERLRSQGKRVWGAGFGEEMELHRWEFKEWLKKQGMDVQPMEHIFGFEKLRNHLKKVENKYVKTSFTRGDFETFRHETYALSEPRLDDLEHHLGIVKDDYEFIVEDEIPDAVEVGYDGFTVRGQFPKLGMMAYEVKDCGMIGCVKTYDELAEPVKKVNAGLVAAFRADNYCGFFCSEIRYTKDKKAYFIDPCCRLGTPSNELLQELFDNWPQVLWDGAGGVCTTPRKKFEFGCMAVIHSEFAVENTQSISYPKEIDEYVKLRFHVRRNGKDYVAPQTIGLPDLGVVVGVGNSLLEAINLCKKRAAMIKGFGIEVSLGSIDKALDTIREGEKMGVKFTDKPLPTLGELKKG